MIAIRTDAWSDVGKARDHNEDSLLVDAELGLCIVCDGMGGHAAGEVASQAAVKGIRDEVRLAITELRRVALRDSVVAKDTLSKKVEDIVTKVCHDVYTLAVEEQGKAGMGTTLVMSLHLGDFLVVAHVGDSRAYLFRDGQMHQLTEDHSYCQEMIRRGKMTPAEALKSPYANVITRAVGIQEHVESDVLVMNLFEGDRVLLCSDGYHGCFDDPDRIAAHVVGIPLEDLAKRLCGYSNEAGGPDNISCILLDAYQEVEHTQVQERSDIKDRSESQDINLRLAAIRKVPLFKHLSYTELMRFLALAEVRKYPAGETVFDATFDAGLRIVMGGEVELTTPSGVCIRLSSGQHFGDMELLDGGESAAVIRAVSPARIVSVSRDRIFKLVREQPVLGTKLLWSIGSHMSQRLRESDARYQGKSKTTNFPAQEGQDSVLILTSEERHDGL